MNCVTFDCDLPVVGFLGLIGRPPTIGYCHGHLLAEINQRIDNNVPFSCAPWMVIAKRSAAA